MNEVSHIWDPISASVCVCGQFEWHKWNLIAFLTRYHTHTQPLEAPMYTLVYIFIWHLCNVRPHLQQMQQAWKMQHWRWVGKGEGPGDHVAQWAASSSEQWPSSSAVDPFRRSVMLIEKHLKSSDNRKPKANIWFAKEAYLQTVEIP